MEKPLQDFLETIKEKGKDIYNLDLIDHLWKSTLSIESKIKLSLEIYDMEPSYSVLTNLWANYSSSKEGSNHYNEIILNKYQQELSDPTKDLEMSTEYSLYFDIFEDPERNEDAWNYFMNNYPSDRFLKIMLENSGPVPYCLKHELHLSLIINKDFHVSIYKSIRHSCFDNCGNIDVDKAREVFQKLDLKKKMNELIEKGHRNYNEVKSFLNVC